MNAIGVPQFATCLKSATEDRFRRLASRLRGGGREVNIQIDVETGTEVFSLKLSSPHEQAALVIPKPYQNEFGNWLLGERSDRALCPMMLVTEGKAQHIAYDEMVMYLLFSSLEQLFPKQGRKSHIERILWGMATRRGRLAVSLCQRFLNAELFNMFPLSGTPMQDWAMNRRLMIFDPIFSTLVPDQKLEYQRRKNELLHPCSSIGLSDGAAAVRNYILQEDLKRLVAFGRHHNPIRNLYSTLGIKGEEKALVISGPMAKLEKQGIYRGGWNLMTAFLDVPDNFEDQILVSPRHAGREVSYTRTYTIFGMALVEVGNTIQPGKELGQNMDESKVAFDIDCDRAVVEAITESVVPFDGLDEPVTIVSLRVFYTLKEGFKVTNQHGNKGIVVLRELGTMHDPVRGEVPIDVLVSAKSIQKRKNFGQVLEAWTTLIHGNQKRHVIAEDLEVSEEQARKALQRAGYSQEGTCSVSTPWGTFDTICGWVHWGITKTPEEQLWTAKEVRKKDRRGLRTRGNKLSPVELKSLITLLGPKSAAVKEILSYQQGAPEVKELLSILKGMRGEYIETVPVIEADKFCYLPSGMGTFYEQGQLEGTIADKEMYPKGCYIKLPFTLQTIVPQDPRSDIVEAIAGRSAYESEEPHRVFETDRIMVPNVELRLPWHHPTDKYGLPDISSLLNQILEAIDRFERKEIKETQLSALVYRYWRFIGAALSGKRGKISTYLMSVRYPWSSKATAVLGSGLEENWIEIHKDMADGLKVQDGDYVLVERFPCLGFMSTRIQRVKITKDPQCKYVIRVSGNSLVSMNLDFDGDVIYVMSFQSEKAKEELKANFHNPHPRVAEVLDQLNSRKKPMLRAMSMSELGLRSFAPLSPKEHADLNALSLAVKIYTGPVIALCYNLMRIVEGNIPYEDRNAHIYVEFFLDKVGNSVFSQKHGVRSLREECVEAICLADVPALVALGFPEKESQQLCGIIREKAAQLGVRGDDRLRAHYNRHMEEGRSNIINAIVRRFHPAYFATRSALHPLRFLDGLESKPTDLVGHLIARGLAM